MIVSLNRRFAVIFTNEDRIIFKKIKTPLLSIVRSDRSDAEMMFALVDEANDKRCDREKRSAETNGDSF